MRIRNGEGTSREAASENTLFVAVRPHVGRSHRRSSVQDPRQSRLVLL